MSNYNSVHAGDQFNDIVLGCGRDVEITNAVSLVGHNPSALGHLCRNCRKLYIFSIIVWVGGRVLLPEPRLFLMSTYCFQHVELGPVIRVRRIRIQKPTDAIGEFTQKPFFALPLA